MSRPQKQLRDVILAALPGTQTDIQHRTGLAASTVCRWITDLRIAEEIHVESWAVPLAGGRPVGTWVAGKGKNAPKPKTTPAQRNERQAERMRALRDKVHRIPQRDPLMAALFAVTP